MKRTHLENFQSLIRTGQGEWMPFSLDVGSLPGFTEPILERFRQETGVKRPEEFFDYDFRTVSLSARFGGGDPSALHESVEPGTTFDAWGIGHWAGGAEATYEKVYPPLAKAESAADVESLPTPVTETGPAGGAVREYHERGYPVFGYAGSVYEWSWWLRGMEACMMDLAANPVLAEAVIEKVAAYTTSLALESARTGIDVLCFYDDAGMQTGLQLSPEMWRRFIKPRWRDILDTVRRAYPETIFFLHSCGKIDEIIPDIIDVGFHILHPIQPECMEFESIHRRYCRDLTLCACISAQRMFPFGTPDEITHWVRGVKNLCVPENRGLMCPSNMVQPETPWENIVAFVEAAREA